MKPIPGYEGLYSADEQGNIYSHRYTTTNILKPLERVHGYLGVIFSIDAVRKNIAIHRLIALTFIPNPENKQEVNHKNGIKTDNRAENLEWCTRSENLKHAYHELKMFRNNHKLCLDLRTGIYYDTLKDACYARGTHPKSGRIRGRAAGIIFV